MPGCGAAAAVCAGLGLALVLKGLRLSEARSSVPVRVALIERGDDLRDTLARLGDADVAAFERYLEIMKQPHAKPEQARRHDQLARAIEKTCRVPLEIACASRDGLALGVEALEQTSARLRSDTQAGLRLMHAGLNAVLIGFDDNLADIDDAALRNVLAQERHALQAEADALLGRVGD